MPFDLDLRRRIQEVLAESEVKLAMADTVAGIDDEYVYRHVLALRPEMEGQLARQMQQLAEVEAQLEARRKELAEGTANRWYGELLGTVPGVLIIAGGVLFVAYLLGADLLSWARAAIDLSRLNFANGVVGAFLLLVLTTGAAHLNWLIRLKPVAALLAREDGRLAHLTADCQAAEAALKIQATDLVQRNVFEVVNSGKAPFFQKQLLFAARKGSAALRVTSGSGLSEVADKHHEAPTAMRREIVGLLESLPGASIGISGSRGAGKSTLLRSLCGANFPLRGKQAIAIYTAAPVEYEPRDFLLHLFITLCRQVIVTHDPGALPDAPPPASAPIHAATNGLSALLADRLAGRILFVTGLIVMAFATLVSVINFTAASGGFLKSLNLSGGPMLVFGLGLALLGLIILAVALRDEASGDFGWILRALGRLAAGPVERVAVEAPSTPEEVLAKASQERLQNLKFQRTFTSGWSGALKAPIGVEMSVTGSHALAQRQESYPELVQSFRDYVAQVVAVHGHVVIAIDELDKMKTAEDAETFVNEIKSIFNIPCCFFLVSVSEDALSGFERRGLALRDAFDSAFDDIRYLGHLDLDGSRRLLFRRFLNLPDPFLCLCHVLSGGLPRDLIRLARAMLLAAQSGDGRLSTVARKLIRDEVAAKTRASIIAARALGMTPSAVEFLVALAALERAPIGNADFDARLETIENLKFEEGTTPETRRLSIIRNEFTAYLRFLELALTMLRQMEEEKDWQDMVGKGHVERVAQIRQGLEANAAVGQARLRVARNALLAMLARRGTK